MSALYTILIWLSSLFGFQAPEQEYISADSQTRLSGSTPGQVEGVHIVNINPRTVVALEDTHFRPSK